MWRPQLELLGFCENNDHGVALPFPSYDVEELLHSTQRVHDVLVWRFVLFVFGAAFFILKKDYLSGIRDETATNSSRRSISSREIKTTKHW